MPSSPPKIYVESCAFIDLAKTRRGIELKEPGRLRHIWFAEQILRASRAGDLEVYTSAMTSIECVHIDQQYTPEIQQVFRALLSGASGVTIIQPNPFVIEKARQLRWVHDIVLKPMDSFHVASALEAECVEFVTTDGAILKRVNPINAKNLPLRAILAADTAYLSDKHRQAVLALENAPKPKPTEVEASIPMAPEPKGRKIKRPFED